MRLLCLLALLLPVLAHSLPQRLSETPLSHAAVLPYEPQHQLWSDGAHKQRWILLPPGQQVDARDADAWRFPRGTWLWKQFALQGQPVETRVMHLNAQGQWEYGTYRWQGAEALLVSPEGEPAHRLPDGRAYALPSRADCLACHAGARSPVLGFAAVPLGDRLPQWVESRLLRGSSHRPVSLDPAQGYLHANCAHCHHPQGVPVALNLFVSSHAGATPPTERQRAEMQRRMRTRNPYAQMPPLGTRHIDADALALLQSFLNPPRSIAP